MSDEQKPRIQGLLIPGKPTAEQLEAAAAWSRAQYDAYLERRRGSPGDTSARTPV